MPRAHRYFLPNHVWHITHRCHKKEFLLKFARDRGNWIKWLFEARKRFGLEILNYVVTSNHIHLLVYGDEQRMSSRNPYSSLPEEPARHTILEKTEREPSGKTGTMPQPWARIPTLNDVLWTLIFTQWSTLYGPAFKMISPGNHGQAGPSKADKFMHA